MKNSIILSCALVILNMSALVPSAQATSWLGWGQDKKEKPKQIPGMAPPIEKQSGATPDTSPAKPELSREDMSVMTKIMEDQTNALRSIGDAITKNEAEYNARLQFAQQVALRDAQIAALSAQSLLSTGEGAVTAPQPPISTEAPAAKNAALVAPAIQPYVVPQRAPVNEWQAIVDSQKKTAPPTGNITVKSPPPAATPPR